MTQVRPALVAGHEADGGGEVATGAVAAHRDPVGVAADLGRELGGPLGRGVAVLDRRREGVFGREPVVHREHETVGLVGDPATHRVVGVEAPDDPATAVEGHEHRERAVGGLGGVEPHRERTRWPLDIEVSNLPDGLGVGRGEQLFELVACGLDRDAVGRWRALFVQGIEQRTDLGIEFRGHRV